MDDRIKNQLGDSTSGSSGNGPVTSPLDNLVVPDASNPPPDLAPPSSPPQSGQSAGADASLDDLASQALQDIHAATNSPSGSEDLAEPGSEPAPPPPRDQSVKPNEMDIQDSLNSLVQSAAPDAQTPSEDQTDQPATTLPEGQDISPPPVAANETSSVSLADSPPADAPSEPATDLPEKVPESFSGQEEQAEAGSVHDPAEIDATPGSLVIPDPPDQQSDNPPPDALSHQSSSQEPVPDKPSKTDAPSSSNQEPVPESFVVPEVPAQKAQGQSAAEALSQTTSPDQPPVPPESGQAEKPETPPLSGDLSAVNNPAEPAQSPPPIQPVPERTESPQQPIQPNTPAGPTLPDLPASAEISVKKEIAPPPQTRKKSPGGGIPRLQLPGKNILAIGAVIFFLGALGVSIPAINQQLTLSNRASEPVGTQSCYQPCDFTSNLCRDGFVCGAIQKCDEENPDQCEKQNLCYNPQCKENNTCDCTQESTGQSAAVAPGAQGSDNAVCSFNTRTAVQAGDQLIESIVTKGLFWNYDENGELWEGSTEEGTRLATVDRYANGPCKGQAECRFDTRTTYKQGEETIESVTVGNRLWNYDSQGNLWGGTTEEGTKLTDIPHYAEGPCKNQDQCHFDTRSVTTINGQRVESITIGDKYWNYDENANPLAGTSKEGTDLNTVARYAEGPCKNTDSCYFDTRTFFPDGEDMIETITVGNRLWNYDPNGQLWGGTKPEGTELTSVEQYQKGPCRE